MRPFPSVRRRGLAAVLAALLAAAAADAADPFPGTADIALGDTVNASFAGFEGEAHQFTFVANEGATVSASVAAAQGSSARPRLSLRRPGGEPLPVGGAQTSQRQIRKYRIPFAGVFVLQVESSTRGSYSLSTGGHLAGKARQVVPDAAGDTTWRFYAVDGAALSVVASPRGGASGASSVEITGLTDPFGAAVAVAPVRDGAGSRLDGVTLHASGQFTLAFRVAGRATDVGLKFRFDNPDAPPRTLSLGTATGLAPGLVDPGEPDLAPREGYVGSQACGNCHTGVFATWSKTSHNLAARTWDRAGATGRAFTNDANANGADDFRDGLDLATQPAFAAYGSAAPKLSYVEGDALPYKIRVGAVTYDVARVMGGNGTWKQRYLVRVGRSLYPSPVQWNDGVRAYAAYDPADWYDASNQPRYAAADQVPKEKSFAARCSGCHNTGETISVDAASGEVLAGYVEFNIGCEQCHGPGEEHAKKGDPALIANPRTLLDGTAAGVASANAVCGRCHTRGTARDAFPGTAVKAGFGYSASGGVQQFGDVQSDFFVTTTSASDFWGRKTNPVPSLPGDTFVASKSHRQQSLDVDAGAHGPHAYYSATCFECHDPHSRAQPAMIRSQAVRHPGAATAAADNSLCLACHAGFGDFAAVSQADVAAIAGGAKPQSVVRATVDHMKENAAMPVPDARYDPAGTGVGRCDTCHMPLMGRTAAYTADKAGFQQGDLHSHTFLPVWPNVSVLYGSTNSCSVCHPRAPNDATAAVIDQWARRGADGDATFHADTPRSFQNGTANAGSPSGGQRCAACHTTDGFVRIQVRGESLDQGAIDAVVKDAIGHDEGITCRACHGRGPAGGFATGANPLRFPKAQLCGRCHNAQTVVFADFRDRGEMVRHPQKEMFEGVAGARSPGYPGWDTSAHSGFSDGCVACHLDRSRAPQEATHEFRPSVASCSGCHPGLTSFDRTARGDYDGDGVVEGIQTETQGLLDVLEAALLLNPSIAYVNGYFEYGGASDHRMAGATEAEKRAAYNHYSVSFDASRGVHNTASAIQLLQRSYRELRGADVPGATIR